MKDKIIEILKTYSMRYGQLLATDDDIIIEASDFEQIANRLIEPIEPNTSQAQDAGWKCTTCGSYFTRELKQDYCPVCNHYAIEKI